MQRSKKHKGWSVISEISRLKTPWLTLVGERLRDDDKNELEYWRVEKPDGIIVITILKNQIILPRPMYRPGVGKYTLDFCGGRIPPKVSRNQAAEIIVKRELGLGSKNVFANIKPINKTPWNIDSSFTDVKLYGYVATLSPKVDISKANVGKRYPLNQKGIQRLLADLDCLQCRATVLEWWHSN